MSEPKPLLSPVKPRTTEPRLWKNGQFVVDPWHVLPAESAWPAAGHAIVDLARWRREKDQIRALGGAAGVYVGMANDLDPASEDVAGLQLLALAFPKFSDGRAYSQARRLREAGFTGELRAVGDVLLDQLPLMLRAGFDAFEVTHVATIDALEAQALPAIDRVYQPAADGASGVRQWQPRRNA